MSCAPPGSEDRIWFEQLVRMLFHFVYVRVSTRLERDPGRTAGTATPIWPGSMRGLQGITEGNVSCLKCSKPDLDEWLKISLNEEVTDGH